LKNENGENTFVAFLELLKVKHTDINIIDKIAFVKK